MYLCLLLPEGNYFKQTSTQPVGDQKGRRAKESKQSQGYRGRHLKWWWGGHKKRAFLCKMMALCLKLKLRLFTYKKLELGMFCYLHSGNSSELVSEQSP